MDGDDHLGEVSASMRTRLVESVVLQMDMAELSWVVDLLTLSDTFISSCTC